MADINHTGALTGAIVSRRRLLAGLGGVAALGAVAPLVAACGGSTTGSGANTAAKTLAPKSGGNLLIDVKTEPQGYNPLVFPNGDVRWLSGQIVDGLYEFDGDGAIVANLAVGAPSTTDGKTWTVNLKSGVKFHNGDPFTADDVVASLKATATAPTNAFGGQLGTITSATAVSPSQVSFTLADTNYMVPDILAVLPMLNKNHIADMVGIIGTGPFMWSSLVSGSHLTLTANQDYHLGRPFLDEVTFRYVPDPTTRDVDVLNGTASVSLLPEFDTLAMLAGNKKLTVIDVPAAVMLPIHVNVKSPVFQDVRVRQALGFAIDRTRVRDIAFAGRAEIFQGGVIPPELRGFDSKNTYFPPTADVAKAKALLAEAGVSTPVKFTVALYNVSEPVAALQVIQQDWAKAGFEANLVTMDLASFASVLISHKFDVAVSYEYNGTWWAKDGINPLSNYLTGNFVNFVNYEDPAFDTLLTQSRATSDQAKQTSMWMQANQMLTEAAINLIPVVPPLTGVAQSDVVGIPLPALSLSFLELQKAAIG
jgi:peptide/nickel transport system substrate-binding protein